MSRAGCSTRDSTKGFKTLGLEALTRNFYEVSNNYDYNKDLGEIQYIHGNKMWLVYLNSDYAEEMTLI